MKNILFILIFLFYIGNLSANNTECTKKAEESFATDRDTCKEKKGEEKAKCLTDARTKKKAAMEECRSAMKSCIEKARTEKQTSMDGCRDKKADEKKECRSAIEKKFEEAKEACKKS